MKRGISDEIMLKKITKENLSYKGKTNVYEIMTIKVPGLIFPMVF